MRLLLVLIVVFMLVAAEGLRRGATSPRLKPAASSGFYMSSATFSSFTSRTSPSPLKDVDLTHKTAVLLEVVGDEESGGEETIESRIEFTPSGEVYFLQTSGGPLLKEVSGSWSLDETNDFIKMIIDRTYVRRNIEVTVRSYYRGAVQAFHKSFASFAGAVCDGFNCDLENETSQEQRRFVLLPCEMF